MVTLPVEVGNRLTQFRQTHRGGVRQRAAIVLFTHRIAHRRWGAEIRFAQTQLDHVGADRDHLIGHCAENHGAERIGYLRTVRYPRQQSSGNNGSCDIFSVSHISVLTARRDKPTLFCGSRPHNAQEFLKHRDCLAYRSRRYHPRRHR